MEEGTILKRRTVIPTKNGEQSKESTEADSEKCKTEIIKDPLNEDEELEDANKQSEQWKKYKAMSFKEKYRMEKSAKVPSVRQIHFVQYIPNKSSLAFVVTCLVIISEWPPLSHRFLWFWCIER